MGGRFEQKVVADVGAVVLVSGTVNIGTMPEVEIKNDVDNPLPVLTVPGPGVWVPGSAENATPVRNQFDAIGNNVPIVTKPSVLTQLPEVDQFCVFAYITGLEAARTSVPARRGYCAKSITVPAGKILIVLDVRFSYCVKLNGAATIYSTNAPTGPLGNQVALSYPPSIYAKLASGFVGPVPVAPAYFDEVASVPVFLFAKTTVRLIGQYQQDGQSGQRKRNKGIFVSGETVHLVSHWDAIANIDAAAGGGVYLEMESVLIDESDAACLLPTLLS